MEIENIESLPKWLDSEKPTLNAVCKRGTFGLPPMTDIPHSLVDIATAVRTRQLKAAEVVEAHLQRIEAGNSKLTAFCYVDADGAMSAALEVDARIERGEDVGILAGVPFGVKDLADCLGMPTTHGSVYYKDSAPVASEPVHVARLRRAGAIAIGKTTTAEFGYSDITDTPAWGTTRNPWNLELTPGGSSGGSAAAVSAGFVPLATASDSAGSTRSPASFCGLVGMKPSHGRIPRKTGASVFASLGALTTTVLDTARYLDVVAGPDELDCMSLPEESVSYEHAAETLKADGLRVAWTNDLGYMGVDPETVEVSRNAAVKLVNAARLTLIDTPVVLPSVFPEWTRLARMNLRGRLISKGFYPGRKNELTPWICEELDNLDPDARDLFDLQEKLISFQDATAALFTQVDVLLSPATACPAFSATGPTPSTIGGKDARGIGVENFSLVGNIAWNPSISIPSGISKNGLPIGLMITGRRHRDDIVLRLARIAELVMPWRIHAPGYPLGT